MCKKYGPDRCTIMWCGAQENRISHGGWAYTRADYGEVILHSSYPTRCHWPYLVVDYCHKCRLAMLSLSLDKSLKSGRGSQSPLRLLKRCAWVGRRSPKWLAWSDTTSMLRICVKSWPSYVQAAQHVSALHLSTWWEHGPYINRL